MFLRPFTRPHHPPKPARGRLCEDLTTAQGPEGIPTGPGYATRRAAIQLVRRAAQPHPPTHATQALSDPDGGVNSSGVIITALASERALLAHTHAPVAQHAPSIAAGGVGFDVPRPLTRPHSSGTPTGPTLDDRARLAALLVDDVLFQAPVFVIDQHNKRTRPHDRLESLPQAAALVHSGHAASYVATLRHTACAIDIDGPDEQWSTSALEHLTATVDDLGGWWITRRSGGGPGHWHLIALLRTPAARTAFRATVDNLRAHWKATARQLDWRNTLRPLSAPHRTTGRSELPADLLKVIRHLPAWARHTPPLPQQARLASPATHDAPAVPRPRQPHTLPATFWRRLLAPEADYYADRSLSELLSTARLIVAGYDVVAAWRVVTNTRHRGFARARRRGYHWWVKHTWNKAVAYVDSRPIHPRSTPAQRWKRITGPLLAGVRHHHWSTWSVARRHSAERLLAAIGDRMARQGLADCPLPRRDLELDTGQSRTTIGQVLRQATRENILIKTRAYRRSDDPSTASDEYSLNLLVLDFRAERSDPPCSHTLGLRGRAWWSLATTLALHPGPHTLTGLYHLSGYTPTLTPTHAQLANLRAGLRPLVACRVIRRASRTTWTLTHSAARIPRAVSRQRQHTAARIERERRMFRISCQATFSNVLSTRLRNASRQHNAPVNVPDRCPPKGPRPQNGQRPSHNGLHDMVSSAIRHLRSQDFTGEEGTRLMRVRMSSVSGAPRLTSACNEVARRCLHGQTGVVDGP